VPTALETKTQRWLQVIDIRLVLQRGAR
jgi:hypothetical protein